MPRKSNHEAFLCKKLIYYFKASTLAFTSASVPSKF